MIKYYRDKFCGMIYWIENGTIMFDDRDDLSTPIESDLTVVQFTKAIKNPKLFEEIPCPLNN